ncbi:MAG: OmpH family outer membrane protein [Verrucomicrobiota bacterium]
MTLKKLGLGLALMSLLNLSAQAEVKIATVSLAKTFDGYYRTKQADAALKDRQTELKKSESEMAESWNKAKEEYQKLVAAASDQAVAAEERDKRKKDAEGKLKEMKDIESSAAQFQRQAATILQEEKARKTKNLIDEIKLAITGIAKTGSYTLVVDSDSVLYTNGENDITEAVLSQLNAGAPQEAPKAEVKKPEPKK